MLTDTNYILYLFFNIILDTFFLIFNNFMLFNYDRIVKVKFMLPAGYAESNTSLNTVFNQYRSTFFNSFVSDFNIKTEKLPADLLLPTIVFIPLPGSKADKCYYEVCLPKSSFFMKKLNLYSLYFDTGMFFFKISLLDLFKLSILKSSNLGVLYKFLVKQFFFSFIGTLKSFNGISSKKILFCCLYFPKIKGNIFYNITFNKDFNSLFFKS